MSSNIIFLIVLVSIAAGYFAWKYFLNNESQATDPDGRVLVLLRRAGSNLAKPHKIEFFLYLPTPEAAEKVRGELLTKGFMAEVTRAARGSDWLCLAVKEMLPIHSDLITLGQQLTYLAKKYGGDYDGWGTPVVD